MPFDYEKFEAASVTFPTKRIPVPLLKDFFQDGEEAIWEIKPLTGLELAVVEEAVENRVFARRKAAVDAINASSGGSIRQLKDGYEELLQSGEEIPVNYVRWIKLVQYGSVPPCPEDLCVKMASVKGGVLRRLAHEIAMLSAMGADLGK